jgi:hypothetical protein
VDEHRHDDERFGARAQAAEWDARYGERDATMWSGRPNGRLVAEVADLDPGTRSMSAAARERTRSGSISAAARERTGTVALLARDAGC